MLYPPPSATCHTDALSSPLHHLHHLQKVDLSDCDGLLASATNLLVTQNKQISHLQLSGCSQALNDEHRRKIELAPALLASDLKQKEFLQASRKEAQASFQSAAAACPGAMLGRPSATSSA